MTSGGREVDVWGALPINQLVCNKRQSKFLTSEVEYCQSCEPQESWLSLEHLMMKSSATWTLPPYVHLASTRRHSRDRCSQAFPVFRALLLPCIILDTYMIQPLFVRLLVPINICILFSPIQLICGTIYLTLQYILSPQLHLNTPYNCITVLIQWMYASISCTLFYASLAFMHKFYKEKNPENRRTKNGEGLGTRLSDPAKTTNKQTNKQTNKHHHQQQQLQVCGRVWVQNVLVCAFQKHPSSPKNSEICIEAFRVPHHHQNSVKVLNKNVFLSKFKSSRSYQQSISQTMLQLNTLFCFVTFIFKPKCSAK